MHRFFDGHEDMARHIKEAEDHIMPIIDFMEKGGVKYRTALFIIFTRRAIKNDELSRDNAHTVIDTLFDVLLEEGANNNTPTE